MQQNQLRIFAALMLFLSICASSCQRPEATRSVCLWKTSLDIDNADWNRMDSLHISHVYMRYFDVDWNPFLKRALPKATLKNWDIRNLRHVKITPTVFITNVVIEKSTDEELDSLAVKIVKRIQKISADVESEFCKNQAYVLADELTRKTGNSYYNRFDSLKIVAKHTFENTIQDILIDCDWIKNTRDKYFHFLKKVRAAMGKEMALGVTLRLWQYRYSDQAGVPPADRCLLMCYSVANPKNYMVKNSISSASEVEKYISGRNYPLKLDIALPMYRWVVTFRNKSFIGISNADDVLNALKDTSMFLPSGNQYYIARHDFVLADKYYRCGDELRLEQLLPHEMEKLVGVVKKHLKADNGSRITLFSWNKEYFDTYGLEKISGFYTLYNH